MKGEALKKGQSKILLSAGRDRYGAIAIFLTVNIYLNINIKLHNYKSRIQ
jgi:hypothetical protein